MVSLCGECTTLRAPVLSIPSSVQTDLAVRPPGRGHGFCDQCKDVLGSSGDRRHLLVGFGQADFASPVDRLVVVQEVRDLFEDVDACRQQSVVRYRVHYVRDRGVQVAVVEVDLAPRRFGGRLRSYHGRGFTQGLHLDGGSGLRSPGCGLRTVSARSQGERTRPAVSRVRSVQGGRCPVRTVSCAPSTRACLVPAALHERGHQGVDEFEQPLRVRVVGTGRGLLSYGIDVVLPVRGVGVLPRCRCFAFRWLLALYRR